MSEITFNDPFSEIPQPTGCTGVLALGGVLRFRLHARGLDLSGARSDPVTMVLALGGAHVTATTPTLRTSTRARLYP